ncbi:MAG: hypothetical protein EBV82_04420 [Chitinophagia bacterium]|jgi:hypothetical protein|nr:hypothetical protein [Chitinophagia bacterium]
MYLLVNQKNETVAYVQNMMILDDTQEHVIGILIGDCFFGKKDHKLIGKIFNQTAYLVNGEIVAKLVLNKDYKSSNIKKSLMTEAWDILMNVNEHTSTWIKESKKWSKLSLTDLLK